MRLNKDIRAAMRPFVEQGYRLESTAKQHIRVVDPQGRQVSVLSGTPSDRRALTNAIRQIMRAAVD